LFSIILHPRADQLNGRLTIGTCTYDQHHATVLFNGPCQPRANACVDRFKLRVQQGMTMQEPTIKFSVRCPDCAMESLSEIPIAMIANALLTGKNIRLYAGCHDQYWTATYLEREQLRKTLGTMTIDALQAS
jgi:hypothetical protein